MKSFAVWTVVPGGIKPPETVITAKYAFLAAETLARSYGYTSQGFVLNREEVPTFLFPGHPGEFLKIIAKEIIE